MSPSKPLNTDLAAVILAGGQGSRMGFIDKPLALLQNKPLLEHILEKCRHQFGHIALSVNRNPEKFGYLNLPLISDCVSQRTSHKNAQKSTMTGPLLGLYSAMVWYREHHANVAYLATLPGDVPVFPEQTFKVLWKKINASEADVSYIVCEEQIQPLFAIWSLKTLEKIECALASGVAGPKFLLPKINSCAVSITPQGISDFENINTLEELKNANNRC